MEMVLCLIVPPYLCVPKAIDWEVSLTLEEDSATGYRLQHLGPAHLLDTSTFMHRAFG